MISQYRSWMKAHVFVGPTWWLGTLWVGLGVAASVYTFVVSAQQLNSSDSGVPSWAGEPRVLEAAAELGATAWILLAIPVLVVTLVRLGRRKPFSGIRLAASVGAWIADVALMLLAEWWSQASPRATYTCRYSANQSWCSMNEFGPAIVIWGELPLCAAFLALGAVVTWILARPAQGQH